MLTGSVISVVVRVSECHDRTVRVLQSHCDCDQSHCSWLESMAGSLSQLPGLSHHQDPAITNYHSERWQTGEWRLETAGPAVCRL